MPVKSTTDMEMRIAELSRASGFSVPTIKYYLREGLLTPGKRTARTQAVYGPEHLRRLHLIRVLTEIGGLPIARVRAIIEAADAAPEVTLALTGDVQYALAGGAIPDQDAALDPATAAALSEVRGHLAELGLSLDPQAPGLLRLADALVALRRIGYEVGPEVFDGQVEAARALAAADLDRVDLGSTPDDVIETVTIGTVLMGASLDALRQLAHEDEIRRRFADRS